MLNSDCSCPTPHSPTTIHQPEKKKTIKRASLVALLIALTMAPHARSNELSGGQQQRVAVARVVASRPRLVLADEPTANLDSKNAEALLQMMRHLRDEHSITFVFSTHDPLVVSYASRVVTLHDGTVVSDELKNSVAEGGEAVRN